MNLCAQPVSTALGVTIGIPCQDQGSQCPRGDLKVLGMSQVDTSRRLELRSGTTARVQTEELEMEGEENDGELLGRVQELKEKLAMAEQAVNSKEAEIKSRYTELDEAKSQALQSYRKLGRWPRS